MSNNTSSTSPLVDSASASQAASSPSSSPPSASSPSFSSSSPRSSLIASSLSSPSVRSDVLPSSGSSPTDVSTAAAPTTSSSAQQSLTSPSSSAPQPSTQEPSSTPVTLPSSSSQAPSSTPAPTTSSAPPPTSTSTSIPKSTATASTPPPSTVETVTSVVTPTTAPGSTTAAPPSTIIITRTQAVSSSPTGGSQTSSTSASTDTSAPGLQSPKGDRTDGGLSTGGKTAIAVVVPVVVVALLVIAGILLWRRRKSKKTAEEARRKEVEEYGFNPNNDPTLPPVGMQSEMAEDQSGYRGWGNTTTSSNRKASTTLTSGMTYSDSNSNPGGYASPGSPTNANYSDTHSGEPLMNTRRQTMDSDGIGALGGAPVAGQNQNGVHRGPSNASSSYSAADRSDNSGDYPLPAHNPQEYYQDNSQGYYHASPYDPNGYGAPQPQPIIRDVSARRNTRIENPSVFPQQGNSGIAQNF